jgi:hypothetical protein
MQGAIWNTWGPVEKVVLAGQLLVFNNQLQVKKKEKDNFRLTTQYYFVHKLRNSNMCIHYITFL